MARVVNQQPRVTILTGGGNGFDDYVTKICQKHSDIQHLICIPPVNKRHRDMTPLTIAQLNAGNASVQRASQTLGRTVTSPVAYQYHQRSAHLVNHASMVIAFGSFDHMRRHVEGNEGWSVQMAKDRGIPLYVFDTDYMEWWEWNKWDNCFVQCEGMSETYVPIPHLQGTVALIGSRQTPPCILPYLEKLIEK